jgi:hypothetical protein
MDAASVVAEIETLKSGHRPAFHFSSAGGFDWRGAGEFAGRRSVGYFETRTHVKLFDIPAYTPRPNRQTPYLQRRHCGALIAPCILLMIIVIL